MRFETINGTLCIMTEPKPLVPSIEYPYVISGIKTKHPSIVTKDMDALLRIFIIAYSDEFEVIGYPVADGSKEWALYQMMQGKKVCNPTLAAEKATRLGYDDVERFNTFWYIVGDAVAEGEGNYGTLSVSSWIAAASSSGWQIYKEPEPESEYKVGDWVEISGRGRTIHGKCISTEGTVSEPNNMIRACGYLFNPDGTDATYRCKTHGYLITRELDPSEVVVKIGCLSGTVEDLSYADNGRFFLVGKATERHPVGMYSILYEEMLDAPTRELVKSLLKAQEEEE